MTLHSFDHGQPGGGLILSSNTLYGTTVAYLFSLNTNGTGFTNLLYLPGSSDATLTLSSNILYGTTSQGGTNGDGSVFAVNTDGTGFTNLHSFSVGTNFPDISLDDYTNDDGKAPMAGLILSGNYLYGTAQFGGTFGNGTVFKINTDGTGFTNLHSFTLTSLSCTPPYTNSDLEPIRLLA